MLSPIARRSGAENAYANWARAQNESYRNDGIKRLTEGIAPDKCIIRSPGTTNMKAPKWRLAMDYVVRAQNLESSLHAVERIASDGRGKPRAVNTDSIHFQQQA